jgi:hypothetical protein
MGCDVACSNAHALTGQYYSGDNSFSGGSSPVTYTNFGEIDISNYQVCVSLPLPLPLSTSHCIHFCFL